MSHTKKTKVAVGAGALIALLAPVAIAPASAAVESSTFFEETAEAFWAVPHVCADGSIVEATLLVRTTRDFETPETSDPEPTARVQYLAVCPEGSVSWGRRNVIPATITSTPDLKGVVATGEGLVRDDFSSALHSVSFDVTWTAEGSPNTDVQTFVAKGFRITHTTRKQRNGTATGVVIADGVTLVDGVANPPAGRPAPFIRTDEDRSIRLP